MGKGCNVSENDDEEMKFGWGEGKYCVLIVEEDVNAELEMPGAGLIFYKIHICILKAPYLIYSKFKADRSANN